MTKDLGDQVKQGVLWTSFFFGIRYVLRLGGHIVIVRLLLPEEFGLMGVALILVQFSRRVSDLGFNQALVQLKKVKSEHYDTIFIINTVLGLLITFVLFFSAPYLAVFFKDLRLTPIFRVVAFDFILRSLGNVPRTILMRKMKFKEIGIADTISHTLQIIAPIVLALLGYGVWSLVWGNVLASASVVLGLFYYGKWFPKFCFRSWAIKEVFSFGVWTSIGRYLVFCIDNCDKFIIAKMLGVEQLGFYERALNLLSIPRVQIQNNLNRVLFPAYSKIQHDDVRTVNGLEKIVRYLALVLCPVMIGIYFVAPSFVEVLYGPTWRQTTVPLQLMCFSSVVYAIARVFFPVLMARKWVRQLALIQGAYLLILIGGIALGIRGGINGVALSVLICSGILLFFIIMYIQSKLPFTPQKFLISQKTAICYGLVQVLFLLLLQFFITPFYAIDSWQMLFFVPIVSLVALAASHAIFRFEDVEEILKTLKWRIKNIRGKKVA